MAMSENAREKIKSEICLSARQDMSIHGVEEVISFDEESVRLKTADGELYIDGNDIKIGVLDTDRGIVTLCGRINAVYFATDTEKQKKGFFGRLMS